MDDEDKRPPRLRPEVELPPESTDTFQLFKTLKKTDGQYIRWRRLPDEGWLGGVCAGLAKRAGVSKRKMRLLFVLGVFLGGASLIYYLLAAAFVPEEGRETVPPKDTGFDDKPYDKTQWEDEGVSDDP